MRAFSENLGQGDVLMLENVRFEPGETKNDPELAARLAELADAYVNDAFGVAHRAHASTVGVARLVPQRAAGLLLEREVRSLTDLLAHPARPLVAVLGGAKVADKIGVLARFLERADTVLIGGAMAFPFLAATGHEVGASLCEQEDVELARELLERKERRRGPMRGFSDDESGQDDDGDDGDGDENIFINMARIVLLLFGVMLRRQL